MAYASRWFRLIITRIANAVFLRTLRKNVTSNPGNWRSRAAAAGSPASSTTTRTEYRRGLFRRRAFAVAAVVAILLPLFLLLPSLLLPSLSLSWLHPTRPPRSVCRGPSGVVPAAVACYPFFLFLMASPAALSDFSCWHPYDPFRVRGVRQSPSRRAAAVGSLLPLVGMEAS